MKKNTHNQYMQKPKATMLSIFVLMFFLLLTGKSFKTFSQNVGINETGRAPDTSAMLDVNADINFNKGFLLPRLTLSQRNSIVLPATSLLIYQTNNTPGFYFNSGTTGNPVWSQLLSSSSAAGWGLTGNTGTNPSTNYIGTSDAQDMVFKTNNTEWIRMTSSGKIGIGTTTPSSLFEISVIPQWTNAINITGNTPGESIVTISQANSRAGSISIKNTNSTKIYLCANNASYFGPQLRAATGIDNCLQIVPVYGQSGTAGATDLLINRTETSIGSGAQNFIDAQVGGTSKFTINTAGDITKIKSVAYTFPSLQGAANTVLQNDGSGNLTWVASSSGGNGWGLTGNSGTNPSTNYIGTSDAQPLMFGYNANKIGKLYQESGNYKTDFILYSPNLSKFTQIGTDQLWNVSQIYTTANSMEFWSNANKTLTLDASQNATFVGTATIGSNANSAQLVVKANSSQSISNPLIQLQKSDGTVIGAINTNSSSNIFMGVGAGGNATSSTGTTVAIGFNAGNHLTSSSNNVAIGYNALNTDATADNNIAIGRDALWKTTGANNTVIGYQGGYNNASGSNNVFIGANAGYNETGSNKLYISNSNTSTPLIGGDFSTGIVTIKDVITLTPRASAPTNPSQGMMYFDSTTNKLMVYDGTAWQACW